MSLHVPEERQNCHSLNRASRLDLQGAGRHSAAPIRVGLEPRQKLGTQARDLPGDGVLAVTVVSDRFPNIGF